MPNYTSAYTGAQLDQGIGIALTNVLKKNNTDSYTPTSEYNPSTKKYVDDGLLTKVALTGDETVAGIKTFSSFPITPSSAPTIDYQVANKKYVNDSISTGILPSGQGYTGTGDKLLGASDSNTRIWLPVAQTATVGTIPKRETDGNIKVGTPTDNAHAAPKTYVDTRFSNVKWEGTQTQYDALSSTQKTQYLFYAIVESGGGGVACFSGNTLVKTMDGYKRIENVTVGDVLFGNQKVLFIYKHKTANILSVHIDSDIHIRVTDGHEFLVGDKYVEIKDLKVGDYLGKDLDKKITSIAILPFNDYVYDIATDNMSYFVSNGDIQVKTENFTKSLYTEGMRNED